MASACVNGVAASPEPFLDCVPSYSSYGWLSPRVSFSRDPADDRPKVAGDKPVLEVAATAEGEADFLDFEFRLGDPATMLSADELFADGKLVPLQLAAARTSAEVRSPERREPWRRAAAEASGSEPCAAAMSPRAPTCSSRWRELLGLRKLRSSKQDLEKAAPAASKIPTSSSRSLKHFLHRNPKSTSIDSSLNLPLLRDPESTSSRLSHSSSSSSSGPDHEDLPRLSLDTDKPSHPPRVRVSRTRSTLQETQAQPATRVGRSTARRAPGAPAMPTTRSASVDSPRMNSSGKVIFQGLGRSSSSPSSFNGGQRIRYRGMEFTPVLNVPVFGLGQRFSAQKKEKEKEKEKEGGAAVSRASVRARMERERA